MKGKQRPIFFSMLAAGLILLQACASLVPLERSRTVTIDPAAAGTEEIRGKLTEGGQYVLGKRELVIRGRRFNMDCTGAVLAIYYYAGIDLTRDFAKYSGNGVTRLYKSLETEELLYDTTLPAPGDIIFWDNTYDRNGDGRWNDPLTHVGMVMSVAANGDVQYVHLNYRKGIILENMNLRKPKVYQRMERGEMRIVNSPMRMRQAGKQHPENWLSGQLFRIFGMGYLF